MRPCSLQILMDILIIDLRPLRGRHTYKASLRSALPDSLQPCWEVWVPLHFIRSRPWLSFLLFFEPQCSGTTLRVCLRRPLVSSSYRPVGKSVSHHFVTQPTFFSFFFGSSYRPSCPPWCSDTTLWVRPWRPLNFFIVVSIYWKSASYRSSLDLSSFGNAINRSAAKLTCSFFLLDRRACYSTCR
jgi:hypothetical protein